MLSPDQAFDTPCVSAGMKGPGVACRWSEREPQRYWPLAFAYFFKKFSCFPFPCSLLSHSSSSGLCSVFHASCSLISKLRLFFIAFLFPLLSPPPFRNRVKGVLSLSTCGTISSQLCAVTCGAPFPRCWPSRPWRRCWHRL